MERGSILFSVKNEWLLQSHSNCNQVHNTHQLYRPKPLLDLNLFLAELKVVI